MREKKCTARQQRELTVLRHMVALYCKKQGHGAKSDLCPHCKEVLHYAEERAKKCPFGAQKGFCSSCSVHCYSPEMRERIKRIMKFSGPRMVLRHPVTLLRHMVEGRVKREGKR